MKLRLAVCGLLMAAVVLLGQPVTEAQSIKIAYIDVEKMVSESERVKRIIEPLKVKYDVQATAFSERRDTLEERFQSLKARTDQNTEEELRSEYERLVTEEEALLQDVRREAQVFAREQEENLRPLLLEIREQLQKIGRERGLDFIFRKQDLPYIDVKYDITEEVMDRIDESIAAGGE